MNKITIFTPTYNRVDKLYNLFLSLQKQDCGEFEWLIVDDGSMDDTTRSVECWKKVAKFKIHYYKQQNMGKMAAYKLAVKHIGTEYYMCVDSDDVLTESAVRLMYTSIENIVSDTKSCSIIGCVFPQILKGTEDRWVPNDVKYVNIMDLKYIYSVTECSILISTNIVKKIDIPLEKNEKFLSEEILYNLLAEYGKFLVQNDSFYLSEYQKDGLTQNIFEVWKKNPVGTYKLFNSRYNAVSNIEKPFKYREIIKCILNFNSYYMAMGDKGLRRKSPNWILSVILWFPAIVLKRIRYN